MITIGHHQAVALVFRSTEELEAVAEQLRLQAEGRRARGATGCAVYAIVDDGISEEGAELVLDRLAAAGEIFFKMPDLPHEDHEG